jgi:hypothetical protein
MKYRIEVEFEEFGWTALHEAATRQGASVEEVIRHATLHYLATEDEARQSYKIPVEPAPPARAQGQV